MVGWFIIIVKCSKPFYNRRENNAAKHAPSSLSGGIGAFFVVWEAIDWDLRQPIKHGYRSILEVVRESVEIGWSEAMGMGSACF